MKATVKLPKSIKRMLAMMDKPARSSFLKLYVAALAQDAGRSRRSPVLAATNDQD